MKITLASTVGWCFFIPYTVKPTKRVYVPHCCYTVESGIMNRKPVNSNKGDSEDSQVIHFLWQKDVKIILNLKINGGGCADKAPQQIGHWR